MVDVNRRDVLRALGASAVAATGAGTANASNGGTLEVAIYQSQLVHDELGTHPQDIVAKHLRAMLEVAGFEPADGSPVIGVADPSAVPDYVPDRLVADQVWGEYEVRTPSETPATVLDDPILDDFTRWGGSSDVNGDGDREPTRPANGDAGWDHYHQFLARSEQSAKDSNLILLGGPGGRSFGDSCVKSVALEDGSSPLEEITSLKLARDASQKSAQKLYHAIHELAHSMTGGAGPGGDHQRGYRWVEGGTRYVTPMARYTLGGKTENACGTDVEVPSANETKIYYGVSRCMHSPDGVRGFEINDTEPDWLSKANERRPNAWFTTSESPADTDEPVTVAPGEPLVLDASRAVPKLSAPIERYEWTIDGEVRERGQRIAHTFTSPGQHEVTLTITSGGETDSYTHAIDVDPPPVPAFSYSPEYPDPGEVVQFDAGDTTSPGDGSIDSYEWSFGDEGSASGQTATHSFSEAGVYPVSVTVTDTLGDAETATQHLVVGDPGCGRAFQHTREEGTLSAAGEATHTYQPKTNGPCRVEVSLSGPDGADFDLFLTLDGRTPTPEDSDRESKRPGSDESIVLEGSDVDENTELGLLVRAYDGDGDYVLAVDEWGRVPNQGPTARIDGPTTGGEGQRLEFDAGSSTDPDGSIDSYEWDLGDGTTATGRTVTHRYSSGGSYQVTLTVTDQLGGTDTTSQTVEVDENWWPFW